MGQVGASRKAQSAQSISMLQGTLLGHLNHTVEKAQSTSKRQGIFFQIFNLFQRWKLIGFC